MMRFFETYLAVIVATVSLAYGIFATVWDFHKTKHGKKVLSKAGYLGISGLILLGILNLIVDQQKQHRADLEHREDVAEKKKIADAFGSSVQLSEDNQKQLQENIRQTAAAADAITLTLQHTKSAEAAARNVLSQVNRNLDPISDLTDGFITGWIQPLPADQPYIDGLRDSSSEDGIVEMGAGDANYPSPDSAEGLALLEAFKTFNTMTLTFYQPTSLPPVHRRPAASCLISRK